MLMLMRFGKNFLRIFRRPRAQQDVMVDLHFVFPFVCDGSNGHNLLESCYSLFHDWADSLCRIYFSVPFSKDLSLVREFCSLASVDIYNFHIENMVFIFLLDWRRNDYFTLFLCLLNSAYLLLESLKC